MSEVKFSMKKINTKESVLKLLTSDWNKYIGLQKTKNPLIWLAVFFHNPAMLFSLLYRLINPLIESEIKFIQYLGFVLYVPYFFITYYFLDIHISPWVKIGKGLYIHNKGVIIADSVVAGDNLTLIGPLTIGVERHLGKADAAVIGDNVIIYSGARIIGKAVIGNNVVIGANAVVLKDIPSNSVVGGVPARIIKRIRNE